MAQKYQLPDSLKVWAMKFESEEIVFTPITSLLSEVIDNRGRTCPTAEIGVPLIATNCIGNENLYPVKKNIRHVSVETYKTWFRGHPEPGDVIFVNKGTPGRVCLVPDPIDFCIAQDMVSLRVNEHVNNLYLLAAMRSPQVQNQIQQMQVGSMIPHFKKGDFEKLLIPMRDMPTQKAIGKVYFELSQKIDVNERTSKTLEGIAQTIFKSWFIDFDPVKAKMAGETPAGMDAATAKLFPDSMEESELGLIPKGWEVRSLDEISEYLNGLAMQKFPVTDEDEQLPVIKIAQLRAGNTQGADVASGLLDSRFIIKDGDILFSWSGTLEVETWAGGPGALNQHLFKVSGKTVPDWYSYLSTKGFLSFFREIASGKATTMGHIQRGHLSESKLAIPNLELLNRATEIIEPLISLKIKTSIESRNLAEIRDSLLPRLISGELQIPEEMLAS